MFDDPVKQQTFKQFIEKVSRRYGTNIQIEDKPTMTTNAKSVTERDLILAKREAFITARRDSLCDLAAIVMNNKFIIDGKGFPRPEAYVVLTDGTVQLTPKGEQLLRNEAKKKFPLPEVPRPIVIHYSEESIKRWKTRGMTPCVAVAYRLANGVLQFQMLNDVTAPLGDKWEGPDAFLGHSNVVIDPSHFADPVKDLDLLAGLYNRPTMTDPADL